MSKITGKTFLRLFLLAGGIALAGAVLAQAPGGGRPIRIIAGSAAGGIADLLARPVADAMSKSLGVPVIVENRPGAGGFIAVSELTRSPADGTTILQISATVSVLNQFLFSKLPYDPEADIQPVRMTAEVPMLFVVNPAVPVKSVEEFVAAAKASPGKLTYGFGGLGFPAHISFERFRAAAGIDVLPVAYKSGQPAVQDMLGGRIDTMIEGISLLESHILDGKLRLLAVATAKRLPAFPDVPTVAERGYPGYMTNIWIGMAVKSGTPTPVVGKLNSEIAAALATSPVKDSYARLRFDIRETASPKEFADFIAAERRVWGPVIRNANVRLD